MYVYVFVKFTNLHYSMSVRKKRSEAKKNKSVNRNNNITLQKYPQKINIICLKIKYEVQLLIIRKLQRFLRQKKDRDEERNTFYLYDIQLPQNDNYSNAENNYFSKFQIQLLLVISSIQ